MRNQILLTFLVVIVLAVNQAFAETPSTSAVERLANENVTRLEWGIEKLKRALVETFSIDPLTLETSSPRFFVNVSFIREDEQILVEIGRTFASVNEQSAKELCGEYIGRVRGLLSVDRLGRPSIKKSSSLAADFFHPLSAAGEPDVAFAQALDAAVMLRALVASPLNGVFAICTASLTHSPVQYLD